jgi:hypothetical protein
MVTRKGSKDEIDEFHYANIPTAVSTGMNETRRANQYGKKKIKGPVGQTRAGWAR